MTTRTFNGIYLDGDKVMDVMFEDEEEYDSWYKCTNALKEEASRIIAAHPDPEDLSSAGAEAIRNWILHVNTMLEARIPVIPSVLKVRNDWTQLIREA